MATTTTTRPRCYCCEFPQPIGAHWHDLAICDACGDDAVLVDLAPNGFLLCADCAGIS